MRFYLIADVLETFTPLWRAGDTIPLGLNEDEEGAEQRSGREEARTEFVDRVDPLVPDRQKMVLLKHPRACLRMDEADPRPNVCDGSNLVYVRLDESHRVEPVEHLPQA